MNGKEYTLNQMIGYGQMMGHDAGKGVVCASHNLALRLYGNGGEQRVALQWGVPEYPRYPGDLALLEIGAQVVQYKGGNHRWVILLRLPTRTWEPLGLRTGSVAESDPEGMVYHALRALVWARMPYTDSRYWCADKPRCTYKDTEVIGMLLWRRPGEERLLHIRNLGALQPFSLVEQGKYSDPKLVVRTISGHDRSDAEALRDLILSA